MSHQKAHDAIIAERRRQRTELGYSRDHDRSHGASELLRAGRAYLTGDVNLWPWERTGFKPRTHIRNLVRAGALFLAAADVAPSGSGTHYQAERLVESTVQTLAAEIAQVQIIAPGIAPAPRAFSPARRGSLPRIFQEGDSAKLAVTVARVNFEQALIEFTSMEGPYSVRVPVVELS